jgi:hypothetical protein
MTLIKNVRILTPAKKRDIAAKNLYKCKNKPENQYSLLSSESQESKKFKHVHVYRTWNCPLYKNGGDGGFTHENNYEIDHREELRYNGTDTEDNWFPLCTLCHKEKTSRFNNLEQRSIIWHSDFYEKQKEFYKNQQEILRKQIEIKMTNHHQEELDKQKELIKNIHAILKIQNELYKKVETCYEIDYIKNKKIKTLKKQDYETWKKLDDEEWNKLLKEEKIKNLDLKKTKIC